MYIFLAHKRFMKKIFKRRIEIDLYLWHADIGKSKALKFRQESQAEIFDCWIIQIEFLVLRFPDGIKIMKIILELSQEFTIEYLVTDE